MGSRGIEDRQGNNPKLDAAVQDAREEEKQNNIQEAFNLLDIIDAEFQSDPMSVQCFDLRIVDRVKACVAQRKREQQDES
jgi:hypothetical protein